MVSIIKNQLLKHLSRLVDFVPRVPWMNQYVHARRTHPSTHILSHNVLSTSSTATISNNDLPAPHSQVHQEPVLGQNQHQHISRRRRTIQFAIRRRCPQRTARTAGLATDYVGLVQSCILPHQLDKTQKRSDHDAPGRS